MQLLFNKGADISAVDARYLLLLVKSYLRHNAGCRGCTAINIAAEAGLLSNVEWLVNKGANINWRNAKRQTPLYAAASKNRLVLQISEIPILTLMFPFEGTTWYVICYTTTRSQTWTRKREQHRFSSRLKMDLSRWSNYCINIKLVPCPAFPPYLLLST